MLPSMCCKLIMESTFEITLLTTTIGFQLPIFRYKKRGNSRTDIPVVTIRQNSIEGSSRERSILNMHIFRHKMSKLKIPLRFKGTESN